MNRDSFGIDLACLAGSLEERLAAAHEAGFTQITLWARDLANHSAGYRAAIRCVRDSDLQVTGLQLMRNYEGLDGAPHVHRTDVAKALLEVCVEVGAPLLLVQAAAAAEPASNPVRAADDLRRLANLAVPAGVRIGFKAVPWSHTARTVTQAWDLVGRVGHANLGLVLDAFHCITTGMAPEALNDIPPAKILLVQLADLGVAAPRGPDRQTGEPVRVFPGDGTRHDPLAALLRHLGWLGYEGAYSLAACNEDYRTLPAKVVAGFAARSVDWVNAQVLRRRLPLNRMPAP